MLLFSTVEENWWIFIVCRWGISRWHNVGVCGDGVVSCAGEQCWILTVFR